MPITYAIDPVKRLVTTRLWGVMIDEELHEHNMKLRSHPDFNPGYRQLVDMTGVTEIRVATSTINETSADHFFEPGTPRAFVASADAVYGMARKFALQAEAQGQTIHVFRDMDSAKKWLGI